MYRVNGEVNMYRALAKLSLRKQNSIKIVYILYNTLMAIKASFSCYA